MGEYTGRSVFLSNATLSNVLYLTLYHLAYQLSFYLAPMFTYATRNFLDFLFSPPLFPFSTAIFLIYHNTYQLGISIPLSPLTLLFYSYISKCLHSVLMPKFSSSLLGWKELTLWLAEVSKLFL